MNNVRNILNINEVHEVDICGKDIVFAVLDTGIYEHPDINGRIVKFVDFVNERTNPYDDNGHGTHIAGILIGDGSYSRGKYTGICPKAKIIALKVLDERGKGDEKKVIDACNWIIDNKINYGINIVNISFGTECKGEECLHSDMIKAVERMWDVGLTVVAAAGNNGPGEETVTSPGISKKIITVGAMNDNNRVIIEGKRVREYSGQGKSGDIYVKPDLIAPASNIISCGINKSNRSRWYVAKSGTSMAAPIVCGVIGLYMEKYKIKNNTQIKKRLIGCCTDRKLPKVRQGAGLINPSRFMDMR